MLSFITTAAAAVIYIYICVMVMNDIPDVSEKKSFVSDKDPKNAQYTRSADHPISARIFHLFKTKEWMRHKGIQKMPGVYRSVLAEIQIRRWLIYCFCVSVLNTHYQHNVFVNRVVVQRPENVFDCMALSAGMAPKPIKIYIFF